MCSTVLWRVSDERYSVVLVEKDSESGAAYLDDRITSAHRTAAVPGDCPTSQMDPLQILTGERSRQFGYGPKGRSLTRVLRVHDDITASQTPFV
mmetsp:Transcript_11274/g.31319  ORF Transcript_11274/g.31319 Transcript_11274/m.31319 type:complete len:94 (-) Transcript_11274:208-489(-)